MVQSVTGLPAREDAIAFMPDCWVHCSVCGRDCGQAIHLCGDFPIDNTVGQVWCLNLCQDCTEKIAHRTKQFV